MSGARRQQKMELRKKQMTLLLHLAEELKRDMEVAPPRSRPPASRARGSSARAGAWAQNDNEQMDAEEGKIAEAKPAAAQGGGDTEMGEAD
jgi:hypothetical protein